jgi:hypothetical protein
VQLRIPSKLPLLRVDLMLKDAKLANKPSVLLFSRPPVVGTTGSSQNKTTGAPQRRLTMEEQRQILLGRAHSSTPLSTYTSTAQSMPSSSSNSQREKRGQNGELAPMGLVALGKRQNKGKPEHPPRSASAGDLNNTSGVVDLVSRNENTPNARVAPRVAQPFPLGDVEVPPQMPGSSQESSHVSSKSKAKRSSRFYQENEEEKEQITKPFPLSDAPAARSKQQFPVWSVEIHSRPVPSSSSVESHSLNHVHGESLPTADDTPPRARLPFPLGTPSKSTASSGLKRASSESPGGSASPSRRIRLSKQRVLLLSFAPHSLNHVTEQSTIGLVLYRG